MEASPVPALPTPIHPGLAAPTHPSPPLNTGASLSLCPAWWTQTYCTLNFCVIVLPVPGLPSRAAGLGGVAVFLVLRSLLYSPDRPALMQLINDDDGGGGTAGASAMLHGTRQNVFVPEQARGGEVG